MIGQTKAKRTLAVAVYNHYSRARSNLTLQQEEQQHRQELYPPTAELDERYHGEQHQHHPTIPAQQQADYYAPNSNGTDLVPTDRIIYDKYGRCMYLALVAMIHAIFVLRGANNTLVSVVPQYISNSSWQRRGWINPPSQNASGAERTSADNKVSTATMEDAPTLDKSNVLLVGPTGSGNI